MRPSTCTVGEVVAKISGILLHIVQYLPSMKSRCSSGLTRETTCAGDRVAWEDQAYLCEAASPCFKLLLIDLDCLSRCPSFTSAPWLAIDRGVGTRLAINRDVKDLRSAAADPWANFLEGRRGINRLRGGEGSRRRRILIGGGQRVRRVDMVFASPVWTTRERLGSRDP